QAACQKIPRPLSYPPGCGFFRLGYDSCRKGVSFVTEMLDPVLVGRKCGLTVQLIVRELLTGATEFSSLGWVRGDITDCIQQTLGIGGGSNDSSGTRADELRGGTRRLGRGN